jgi:diacylglycerol kinase (ATP)
MEDPSERTHRERPVREGRRTPDLHWMLALLEHAPLSRTRKVVRASRWTLQALRWRETAYTHARAASELVARARNVRVSAFAVLTTRPLGWGRTSDSLSALEWSPPGPPRARIIVNPVSGSVRGVDPLRDLRETAQWLTRRGVPTELVATRAAGHATDLAREAVDAGMDIVIAAGGDGTVNNVVQALAGTTTALGVLPMGTVNVWARESGIPLTTSEAREVLLNGVRRRIDLGRAGARYFLMMAGIGVDAEVIRRVEGNWLKRMGLKLIDYALTAGMLGLTQRPAHVRFRLNGRRRSTHALMLIVGNTRLYGGALTFTQQAVADDGLLDVMLIGGGGIWHRVRVASRAVMRHQSLGPQTRYIRCRGIWLESSPSLPVQVDGEYMGRLPMMFSIEPAALTVIVPPTSPLPLFSRPPLE